MGENAILGLGIGTPIANMATGWLEHIGAPGFVTGNMGAIVVILVAFGMHAARDRGWLPNGAISGLPKAGLVVLLAATLSGCTGLVGTMRPIEFTASDTSGTALVVACEIKGIAWGAGDGGLCRVDDDGFVSTVEGGRMSEMPVRLFEAVGRIVGGLFSGIGGAFSAIGAGASGGS